MTKAGRGATVDRPCEPAEGEGRVGAGRGGERRADNARGTRWHGVNRSPAVPQRQSGAMENCSEPRTPAQHRLTFRQYDTTDTTA